MESRTIHELLILLRDNARVKKSYFGFKQRIPSGLCWETCCLCDRSLINEEECDLLINYIRENRPIYCKDVFYGWPEELWTPRKKWLNQQIKLTKK